MNTKKLALNTALALTSLRAQFDEGAFKGTADELVADAKKIEEFIFAPEPAFGGAIVGEDGELRVNGKTFEETFDPLANINPMILPKGLRPMLDKLKAIKKLEVQGDSPLMLVKSHPHLMTYLGTVSLENSDLPHDVQVALCAANIFNMADVVDKFVVIPDVVEIGALPMIQQLLAEQVGKAVDEQGINDPQALEARAQLDRASETVLGLADILNEIQANREGESNCDCPACKFEARGGKLMPLPDDLPPEVKKVVEFAKSIGVEVGLAPVDLKTAPGELAAALIMRSDDKQALQRVRMMVEQTLGK